MIYFKILSHFTVFISQISDIFASRNNAYKKFIKSTEVKLKN